MSLLIRSVIPNIEHSVFRWLKDVTYSRVSAGPEKTLEGWFTQPKALKIVSDYPDDISKITAPTLAIMVSDQRSQSGFRFQSNEPAAQLFGPDRYSIQEDMLSLMIYGFVVGCGNDGASRRYRDNLMNDVYHLMKYVAGDVGITLYASSATVLGSFDVQSIEARRIPSNAYEIEADRYRFVVDAQIVYSNEPEEIE